jgi:hypothetical protein
MIRPIYSHLQKIVTRIFWMYVYLQALCNTNAKESCCSTVSYCIKLKFYTIIMLGVKLHCCILLTLLRSTSGYSGKCYTIFLNFHYKYTVAKSCNRLLPQGLQYFMWISAVKDWKLLAYRTTYVQEFKMQSHHFLSMFHYILGLCDNWRWKG